MSAVNNIMITMNFCHCKLCLSCMWFTSNFYYFTSSTISLCFDFRRLLVVSSNLSSECCVLSVPDVFGSNESADEFVVQEPDDEKYFTMVDNG